jgi:hypothetical protein
VTNYGIIAHCAIMRYTYLLLRNYYFSFLPPLSFIILMTLARQWTQWRRRWHFRGQWKRKGRRGSHEIGWWLVNLSPIFERHLKKPKSKLLPLSLSKRLIHWNTTICRWHPTCPFLWMLRPPYACLPGPSSLQKQALRYHPYSPSRQFWTIGGYVILSRIAVFRAS